MKAKFKANKKLLNQLVNMGFPKDICIKALKATKNSRNIEKNLNKCL